MQRWQTILLNLGVIAFTACALLWCLIRSLRKTDEPAKLGAKWLITLAVFVALAFLVRHTAATGSLSSLLVPFVCVILGVVMSILWAPSIGAALAKPVTSLFDGGDLPPVPRPFYSVARALRGRGNYSEAAAEVRKQLEKFPTDFEGQMLLAEIQVENLNDLPAAEATIKCLCNQPEQHPGNIAFALNTLADWHLKHGHDPESARRVLQNLVERFPHTEMAVLAEQRIARLPTMSHIISSHEHKPLALPKGVENLGLLNSTEYPKPADTDPQKLVAEYVNHLAEQPLDANAREKLAVLYAEHFGRIDLAAEQLEQLIQQLHQPTRYIVRWLNLLADLQIKYGGDINAGRQALQRIIDLVPGSAEAEKAQRRLDLLKLELKPTIPPRAIRLGTYEQDIGLKSKSNAPI